MSRRVIKLKLKNYEKKLPKRLSEAWGWSKKEGKGEVIEPFSGNPYWLNPTGFLIWKLCDGKHTVENIIDAVSSEYDVSRQLAIKDTLGFLLSLQELRLVEF